MQLFNPSISLEKLLRRNSFTCENKKILKQIQPDSCLTQKTQHLIKIPSNILPRTKTSVLIDNIIVATKEKLQTIKRKASKRKTKQKHKIQHPQHSPSNSSYFWTKSSTLHPRLVYHLSSITPTYLVPTIQMTPIVCPHLHPMIAPTSCHSVKTTKQRNISKQNYYLTPYILTDLQSPFHHQHMHLYSDTPYHIHISMLIPSSAILLVLLIACLPYTTSLTNRIYI